MCAFETYFFNECLFNGDYFLAFFWGLFLLRDLQRAYTVDKVLQTLTSTTKKKDWFHRYEAFFLDRCQVWQSDALDW